MTRRRWLTLLLLVFSAALAAAWFAFQSRRPPFNEETAERIRPGMTRAEVESILGVPRSEDKVGQGLAGLSLWSDGDNDIVVSFNKDGLVWNVPDVLSRQDHQPF